MAAGAGARQGGSPASGRVFLFLQGPSSSIFQHLADELERLGHRACRINICAGDRLFWRRPGAVSYRGRLEEWTAFLDDFVGRNAVSEIILLGEERPHHKLARQVAAARGVAVYAVEIGYLRPDWIVIEHDGTGCNSHFPADPDAILRAAVALPAPDFRARYRHTFFADAVRDVAFNLANVFGGVLHPHYRWHALEHPLKEYAGWLGKFAAARRRRQHAAVALARLRAGGARYVLFPLQLQTDYQIRVHSPFRDQQQAIRMVLRSFAAHAPAGLHLLLKVHPLDNGLIDWAGCTARRADALGVGARVHVVDTPDLMGLIAAAVGVVTINSTAGIHALVAGRPVKVLGTALFDLPGLTDQRPLDAFWTAPGVPDARLRDAFLRLMAAAMHERGDFYCEAGARAGAAALAARIHRRGVNMPAAYVPVPPRPLPEKYPPFAD